MTPQAGSRRPLPPLPSPPARRPPLPAVGGAARAPATSAPNATLVERIDLSPTVARFRIRRDEPVSHVEPGQYLSLGSYLDGRLVQRPYSTATPAGSHAELEFLIRLVPGGAFTPHLWSQPPGARVRLGPPKGLFTRIPGDPRTHLFIATGTGLAPFIAMLETLRFEPRPPRVVVVHGVSAVPDLAYRERLTSLAADGRCTYVPAVSRPADPANAGWAGRRGRVDAILDAVCDDHALTPTDTVAYLCGNPEMITAGEGILARRGLPPAAIRSEHYWPGA